MNRLRGALALLLAGLAFAGAVPAQDSHVGGPCIVGTPEAMGTHTLCAGAASAEPAAQVSARTDSKVLLGCMIMAGRSC